MPGTRSALSGFALLLALFFFAWPVHAQEGRGRLQSLPDFVRIAQNAGRAVVNIGAVKASQDGDESETQPSRPKRGKQPKGGDKRPGHSSDERLKPKQERAIGSGFVISSDGYIVTNDHVVGEAKKIQVTLADGGRTYPATLIGHDAETDLALLRITPGKDLPHLSFGSSSQIQVGEWVMAIGNPFGLDHTVTAGIVSGKGRILGTGPFDSFLQTDASINPGNSGGPILNTRGEVVGISTAIVATGQGIGFAIPSDIAKPVIEQLKQGKRISRGWLGVSVQDIDAHAARALGLVSAKGALVSSVLPGEPADKAGLLSGDVILAANSRQVEDSSDLLRVIAFMKPGEKVRLDVLRNGRRLDVSVPLGERAVRLSGNTSVPPAAREAASDRLGLSLRPLNEREAESRGMEKPHGLLVVDVDDDSQAQDSGVKSGDLILSANQTPVDSTPALRNVIEEVAKPRGALLLLIERQGSRLFVTLPLDANGLP